MDTTVTTRWDAGAAAAVVDGVGGERLDTTDLHDRLLYAMDQDAYRVIYRRHFGREIEPRPAKEENAGETTVRPIP